MAAVSASKVIAKAKSFVGTKESPANSNNVIFNTHYYGKAVSGSAYPWCAVFLWDVFRLCGASSLFYGGKKCAYTPTLANYYKNNKRWYSTPKVGDIAFFQWAGSNRICHVGLVIEVISSKQVKTVEGNTAVGNDSNGGEVMIRTRNIKDIKGFGRPAYSAESSTASKPASSSSSSSTSGASGCYNKYTGSSAKVDTVLEAIGVPASYRGNYKNRKPVASANGISNYEGTAAQNNKIIDLAKQGKLKKVGSSSSSASTTSYYAKYTGSSVKVDTVLQAIGVPSQYRGNYKARKPVASANGISNYEGTAAQNNKIIDLAKQGKLKKA